MYEGTEALWRFLFPKFDRRFLLRLTILALTAFAIFRYALMPCFINGASMAPTYSRVGLNLCNRLAYKLHGVKRGDVVVIRYVGRTYFLKRVIALGGDTVEFRNGILYLNGEPREEPYVKYRSGWNLEPRRIAEGDCYVVGDNRGMEMKEHQFGSVALKRIVGAPLW